MDRVIRANGAIRAISGTTPWYPCKVAHPERRAGLLIIRASLLDHIGLFQDLEDLLGVGVDVVARSALKPRDDHIRVEAVDL